MIGQDDGWARKAQEAAWAEKNSTIMGWLGNHPFRSQEIIGPLKSYAFWVALVGVGAWLYFRRK